MVARVTPPALPLPILILTGFLSGAGIRVADPLLAAIAGSFGASVAAAASVVAGFTLAYGLAQPVLGPLGDRLGKLRLISGCMVLYGAATLASAFAPSLWTLTLARAAAGAFAGGLIPVAIALIGDRTSYETRQATLGRFMTGMVLANLITAPLAGVAGDAIGWRPVFGLLGALSLGAAAPLWREAARSDPPAHVRGSSAIPRATPTRFRMPPDSFSGIFFSAPSSSTISSASCTRSSITLRSRMPCSWSGNARFCSTVIESNNAPLWKSMPTLRRTWSRSCSGRPEMFSPSMSTCPLVG